MKKYFCQVNILSFGATHMGALKSYLAKAVFIRSLAP
jgi:hypothetical protein